MLRRAFEERKKKMDNIYFCMETYSYDGRANNDNEVTFRTRYEHWQYGRAYRTEVQKIPKNRNTPSHWISIVFDPHGGEVRNVIRTDTWARVFGRIDTSIDPAIWSNQYRRWLNEGVLPGDALGENSYVFIYALKQYESWEIVAPFENKMIQLTHNFQGNGISGSVGKRALTLDPEKDFLPIKGHGRWDVLTASGEKWWWKETFVVERSGNCGGVWMPLDILESIEASDDPYISVTKTSVSDVTVGNVKPSDVSMKFVEGTEVTDAINGIAYTTDANGEPIPSTIEPLHGLDPSQVKMPEPPKSKVNLVLMAIGIMMIVIGLYIHFKKRYAS